MSMREKIRLTDPEIRELLRTARAMTLVTQGPRGYPHAIAMWFGLDEDLTVRMSTYATSQKVRNIERNPKVTLLVETGIAYHELRGVMIEADAEIITDALDATVQTMVEANARVGIELPAVDDLPLELKQQMAGKRVLLRLTPKRFVSWDHGKLPSSQTPSAIEKS
ncbi:MAG: pyridoxamine 5'-phosphate oxidase family protein [Candidatus Binatia bacterium]|nr:pyridoxamine 5'-phosphate oxidase family protein [Candidatus Binatia bacterium]MDG2008667.1 pyridoxamine 5'-phosphate oxidase family protein [Candidatus Binatia bacterium]